MRLPAVFAQQNPSHSACRDGPNRGDACLCQQIDQHLRRDNLFGRGLDTIVDAAGPNLSLPDQLGESLLKNGCNR
jgi:hypothetical protein